MKIRKKLIEVALPLNDINSAAYEENNIHTGLPANLHTWWSRKPLGVARAILFSSLVDDPSEWCSEERAVLERQSLFSIVSRLATVKGATDIDLLDQARQEILRSTGGKMPAFWDPFCGGGSLPLEALRLGMTPIGTDINPVAVLITRILIQLAPRQAFHPSVSPGSTLDLVQSQAPFEGLKKDVEYYSEMIRSRLADRMARSFPDASIPKEKGGGHGQVVAWIWTRIVTCPNPSCRALAPLVNKFTLSTHVGNEAHVVPTYDPSSRSFTFSIRTKGKPPTGTVTRSGAMCLACDDPIPFPHIRTEGIAGRIGYAMMALAVEGPKGRIYLEPTLEHLKAAEECSSDWEPDSELPESALGFRVQGYGITRHRDLFTNRQMATLSCLAEIINEMRHDIIRDSGNDAAYADLVQVFLALSLSRVAQTNNTLVRWLVRASGTSKGTPAFDRPIVSMVWEFSEGNPLGGSVGSWKAAVKNPLTALKSVPASEIVGESIQHDASTFLGRASDYVVSTDPPYFDAIGYSDLADFFYIWLRKAIGNVYPDIFGTMLVPKEADLTRNLGRKNVPKRISTEQFLDGLQAAFGAIRNAASDQIPVTVYYAFKQTEGKASTKNCGATGAVSTGWETLLEGLIRSGFCITGTWPLRTESPSRLRAIGSNALASSIILVCRKRPADAVIATHRELVATLKAELPAALLHLQRGNIAPVDLAQAAIGPGMAVYTRYSKVIDPEGETFTVRKALALINRILDEALTEQEGDFDADSRWALTWFEQCGFDEGDFGVAEQLSKSKNTSVSGLVDAGILLSKAGKVRLLSPAELPVDWNPATDKRLSAWECVHQLIRALEAPAGGGEKAAAALAAQLGGYAETARELCYRLYTLCERKNRAADAMSYNGLVQSWPEIMRLARESQTTGPLETGELFGEA